MLTSNRTHGQGSRSASAAAPINQASSPGTYAQVTPKWLPWTLMPTRRSSVGHGSMSHAPQLERVDWHPEMLRLMVNIVPEVRSTFSVEQMCALAHALRPVVRRHELEYRASLPLFGRRFYVALFAGRERRTLARLERSGQLGLKVRLIALVIILCVAVGAITIGIVAWKAMALAVQALDLAL